MGFWFALRAERQLFPVYLVWINRLAIAWSDAFLSIPLSAK